MHCHFLLIHYLINIAIPAEMFSKKTNLLLQHEYQISIQLSLLVFSRICI